MVCLALVYIGCSIKIISPYLERFKIFVGASFVEKSSTSSTFYWILAKMIDNGKIAQSMRNIPNIALFPFSNLIDFYFSTILAFRWSVSSLSDWHKICSILNSWVTFSTFFSFS